MKKLIFTLAMILSFSGLFAQQERELVLLEIATGTWCTYCPGAAMGADDLIANGDPVAVVENHNGDPFANAYSNARNSYYSVSSYPTAKFDGSYNEVVGGSNSQSLYGSYLPIVNARMLISTSYGVEIYGENTVGDEYEIIVRINKVADYDGNMVVHLALTESHIPANWFGLTEVNFVNRLMAPDQNGTAIDMNTGEEQDIELNFTFNNSWDIDHCELVAWVQDNSNKEVMHCAKVALNDLEAAEPTFFADFSADASEICEGDYVNFEDKCIGDPISYHWTFEGGYPEESWDEEPSVWYGNSGSYDVTLTISDGTDESTMIKEKYITVASLEEVEFAEVPIQCVFWEPHMLTEGTPEGGVYVGEGVYEEGGNYYFDPEIAGLGDHTITYTYDNGCEVAEDRVITVDACTSVDEMVNGIAVSAYPNPTNGKLFLDLNSNDIKSASVRIVNAMGAIVYQQNETRVNGQNSQVIDLSNMSQGVYFLVIESEKEVYNKKIMLRN